MDWLRDHSALLHPYESTIVNEGCVESGERVAFNIQIAAQMIGDRLIPVCNCLCEPIHLNTFGQPIECRQFRREISIHKNDLSCGALDPPAREIRLGEGDEIFASRAKCCSGERRQVRKAPVFIMDSGKPRFTEERKRILAK